MIRNNKKIAVLLWLYHTDLCEEFYELLKPCSDLIDVHLSLCEDNDNATALKTLNKLNSIKSISYYPNCGADIYSFLNELPKINNEYFIKLHSKKSRWGTNMHCDWRHILLDSFIGDRDILLRNIKILSSNTGYLSCKPLTYTNKENTNSEKIKQLLDIIGYPNISNKKRRFSGGNMFGGNTKLFQKILLPHLDKICHLISSETGSVKDIMSGTYCHSLERIFGYIGNLHGYRFSYAAPSTFKIVTPSADRNLLNFRIINNRYIYCTDQANIYGNIISMDKRFFRVKWLHVLDTEDQYYVPTGKRFINTNYIS